MPAMKVLMVFTNHSKLGETEKATGWYLPEGAHPHKVFTEAGLDVTFASPRGAAVPVDPSSVEAFTEDQVCVDFHNDAELKEKLENTIALSNITGADFDAVFFVGGFGTMWDFPEDIHVQRISKEVYESGGVVSAVCHGPVALVNVQLSDGSLLVNDRQVTAFTNSEEEAVECREIVPYTCEDKLKEIGAEFSDGGQFKPNVAIAGRLITGQNPHSAYPCAAAVVSALATQPILDRSLSQLCTDASIAKADLIVDTSIPKTLAVEDAPPDNGSVSSPLPDAANAHFWSDVGTLELDGYVEAIEGVNPSNKDAVLPSLLVEGTCTTEEGQPRMKLNRTLTQAWRNMGKIAA